MVKNLPANAGDAKDASAIPGSRRPPEIGYNNLFQYSCLENSMDRRPWQATGPEVAKRWKQLAYT